MLRMRLPLVLALLLLLVAPGCDNAPSGPPRPTGMGTIGVPDAMHGPSTEADIDGDGVPNEMDFCPSLANADQRDVCTYLAEPPASTGDVAADAVARLNFWRDQLGLARVTEDPALSHGCQAHVDYLLACGEQLGHPILSHDEGGAAGCPDLATAEGAAAGGASVLSLGQIDIGASIDGWLDTLYHRLPLIHPGLQRIGVAFEGTTACVQYRPGTIVAAAPHPILWPVADSTFTRPTFGGAESPCPTLENPMGGGECPSSAAIASIGLHGHTLANPMGHITRLDTGDELPLFHLWWEGGGSSSEGPYVEGTIALVPEPGTELARAVYEATVDVDVDGTPTTYRWRFGIGSIDQTLGCDLFGPQGDFATAIAVTAASLNGRVCTTPDFYRIRPPGSYRASLQYEPHVGRLELVAYDADRNQIGVGMEHDGTEVVMGIPTQGYVEVRGEGGTAVGGYVLVIEAE
jgi:uncharacterized protein YkwD